MIRFIRAFCREEPRRDTAEHGALRELVEYGLVRTLVVVVVAAIVMLVQAEIFVAFTAVAANLAVG